MPPRRLDAPDVGDVTLPRFDVGDEALETALVVAGQCCINETIATAWLSACVEASTSPLALAANRLHLSEEIDHARLGWAFLASGAVSSATRSALGVCLPRLLRANVPHWKEDDPFLPPEGVPGHGHLSAGASRTVAEEAVRDLVVPGFRYLGIAALASGRTRM
jgi:hypothetical protein